MSRSGPGAAALDARLPGAPLVAGNRSVKSAAREQTCAAALPYSFFTA
jgi:hypothetical protein